MKKYLFACFVLTLSACGDAPKQTGTNHRIIKSTEYKETISGQPITVPKHPKVVASIVRILPGESLAPHKHPYPRFAYILKGELDVTLEKGNRQIHSKAGDFVVEAINGWHYGSNNGSEPVELLVIDQIPKSAKTNTIHKH